MTSRMGGAAIGAALAAGALALAAGQAEGAPKSTTIDIRRSLAVTDVEILKLFTFLDVMQKIAASSGDKEATPQSLYHQWWDTQNSDLTADGDGAHCNDEMMRLPGDETLDAETDAGGNLQEQLIASFNGYPFSCPRPEGRLASQDPFTNPDTNPDAYIPIGLFNRFDLAHPDGRHCGEYRIIFAKRSGIEKRILPNNQRNLIIFEAQLPNPARASGLAGCRPIVEFWDSLSRMDAAAERGAALKKFYFEGIPEKNVGAVLEARNLGYSLDKQGVDRNAGQIRTNQFIDGTNFLPTGKRPAVHWMLREFKTFVDCSCGPCHISVVQQPVARNPWGRLFGRTRWHAEAPDFQRALPGALQRLGGTDINALDYRLPQVFDSGQSVMDAVNTTVPWRSYENDYTKNFQRAPQEFRNALKVPGLTAEHIVARVQALSCAGCHELSNGADIGGRRWPQKSLGFVHVSEQDFEDAAPQRYKISEALVTEFLPHRAGIMQKYLSKTLTVTATPTAKDAAPPRAPRLGTCASPNERISRSLMRSWQTEREPVIGGRGVH